jgi:SAM-dependent methyltransferase
LREERFTDSLETERLLPHLAALEEGYGSAYERYAVGKLMEQLATRLGIRTVAEWPANGVLGVPGLKSLPLAFAGQTVTLLNPSEGLLEGALEVWRAANAPVPRVIVGDPEDERAAEVSSFDLVWSFCAFEHARDPDRLARAMVRVAKGHVLVFVQNAWMPGVHLHRFHHRLGRKPWDHGAISAMRAEVVAERLRRAGADIEAIGGCDLPPWPDLDVRLPRFGAVETTLSGGPRPYGPSDPVLSPARAAGVFGRPARLNRFMRSLVAWHDHVEMRLPRGILRWIAHHPYVLARKVR